MLTNEIAAYCRSCIDDPDLTFWSNSDMAVALSIGYNEFRRMISRVDTSYYEVSENFAAPNANFIDLNNILFGSAPTKARCEKIVRIFITDGGTPPNLGTLLRPADSAETLSGGSGWGDQSYWLQNRVLRFNNTMSSPLQIQYLPASQINWVTGISATTYVDDVADEYGDLIALLAIKSYKIKDFAENPMQAAQLAIRTSDLMAYLNEGRSGDSYRFVSSYVGSGSDW